MNQPILPNLPDEIVQQARREHAEELLEEWSNHWGGSDNIEDLIKHRWAIVTQREDDAWVNGIDTVEDIAGYEMGVMHPDGPDAETIEGVYDLETGDPVYYQAHVTVEVVMSYDGASATVSTKEGE
jgi:hypothetical protein